MSKDLSRIFWTAACRRYPSGCWVNEEENLIFKNLVCNCWSKLLLALRTFISCVKSKWLCALSRLSRRGVFLCRVATRLWILSEKQVQKPNFFANFEWWQWRSAYKKVPIGKWRRFRFQEDWNRSAIGKRSTGGPHRFDWETKFDSRELPERSKPTHNYLTFRS